MKSSDLKEIKFDIQNHVEWDTWKETCIPRMRHAASLDIMHLPCLDPHEGTCVIVGAAPSVTAHVDDIKALISDKNTIMSLNASHHWLLCNGIKPNVHVLFEHDLETVETSLGGPPDESVTYYVCSHCAPKLFEELKTHKVVLWHAFIPGEGYDKAVAEIFPGEFMVAGGYATFFRTLTIGLILGYRDFDLFGCDSSFDGPSSHLEGYAIANKEKRVVVWARDPEDKERRRFTTQGGLAFQANEFVNFCAKYQAGMRLRIHGDGLLRYLHESRYPEQYQPRERI